MVMFYYTGLELMRVPKVLRRPIFPGAALATDPPRRRSDSTLRLSPYSTVLMLVSLPLAATMYGCASVPGPGEIGYPYNVDGPYQGRFVFDGQPFDATLNVRTGSRGRVRGAFRVGAPVELEGEVDGVVFDDLLRLTVRYETPQGCESSVEGVLTVESGGDVFEGPVTVDACGEVAGGRMAFRRVDRRRSAPGGR